MAENDDFRLQFLENACSRRPTITMVFVFSGGMLLASIFLALVVDIPEASTIIAWLTVGITAPLCLASGYVLRQCARLRRGEFD